MQWFLCALITFLAWGTADLFYKKGADEKDKYSHLKTSMMVGFVMGAHAICTIIFGDIGYDFNNLWRYLPVSAMYIISMTIGYFGLRYLELSISSPIQNASGAIVCIMCLIFLHKSLDLLSAIAVVLICAGVILLGVFEKKKQSDYESKENKKYKIGMVAFLMPILYCIFDSLGTFFDAWYLDDVDSTFLVNVTEETFEDVANTSYELTFFFCAILIFIYLYVIKKEKFTLFKKTEQTQQDGEGKVAVRNNIQFFRLGAAVLETAGQFTYVIAMSGRGEVAAPMIASYCICSVILSRIFLKEKLDAKQYFVVAIVMIGIALLGVVEGLSE
ncbi:MAG: EamA family transporter [Clostridiales bacterium]|nr:EamA family transporter [Clostridiales bacterium]